MSLTIVAGYALLGGFTGYCRYLFLGPCDTSGPNFESGIGLIALVSIGLLIFRIYRLSRKVILARILVFTEGTIVKEERGNDGRIFGGAMIGNASTKLRTWKHQGAQLVYLTSRRENDEVEAVKNVLKKYAFPKGPVYHRELGEEYSTVAERLRPDVIVEDDCAGIGGEKEMAYPNMRQELRERTRSVVVREFGGIDHLPDSVLGLLNYKSQTLNH